MVGIAQCKDALLTAASRNLDLVMISPHAAPPVCKIMDYGKYIFEQAKKEKEAKKNQKIVCLKEVRISATIEEHDFNFKVKNAIKFLQDGDKVKVSVKFKGRELNYTSLGKIVLNKFADTCLDVGTVEKAPRLEGRSMTMVLSPK